MKISKLGFTILSCFVFSSNVFATAPYQQQIILDTTSAHINNTVPLKIDCKSCTKLIKQDDHTYYIMFNAPSNTETDYITFSYSYGDEKTFCKYNASVTFLLLKNGSVDCKLNYPSNLDPSSTSKACPPKVALFAFTKKNITKLYIDW